MEAETTNLEDDTIKLEAEAQRMLKLDDRDGWRLLFYGIGTGGGIFAAILAASRLNRG